MNRDNLISDVDIYDASREQVQYWLHQTNNGEAKEQLVMNLEFKLEDPDVGAIEKSIELIQKRHESLRTFFKMVNGELKQCVLPYSKELFSPLYFDISAKDGAIEMDAIMEIQKGIAESMNNVGVAPLLKCCIIKVSSSSYFVSISLHHIISDVWSKSIIYKELTLFYSSLQNGFAVESDQHIMQLREYVQLQKKWLTENVAIARDYWREKLSRRHDGYLFERLYKQNDIFGKPPFAASRNIEELTDAQIHDILWKGNTVRFFYHIDGVEFYRIVELSKNLRTSIFAVVCSSIQLLFFLLAGKKAILVSTPFSNRNVPRTETIIGWLAGTVYLNRGIREEATVKEFVYEGYIDCLESCAYPICNHDDFQLSDLPIHVDLFLNYMGKELKVEKKLLPKEFVKNSMKKKGGFFELFIHMEEYEDGLSCQWGYNSEFYSSEMIDYLIREHNKLLEWMCINSDISVRQLEKQMAPMQQQEIFHSANT